MLLSNRFRVRSEQRQGNFSVPSSEAVSRLGESMALFSLNFGTRPPLASGAGIKIRNRLTRTDRSYLNRLVQLSFLSAHVRISVMNQGSLGKAARRFLLRAGVTSETVYSEKKNDCLSLSLSLLLSRKLSFHAVRPF